MIDFEIFAARLKNLRKKSGISQKDLANKINVTYATLSSYENGSGGKVPSLEVIIKIAHYFNVSIEYLLGLDKQEKFEIYSTKEAAYKSLIIALTNLPVELEKNTDEFTGAVKLIFSGGTTNFLEDYFGLRPLLLDESYPDFVKQGAIKSLLDMHSNWSVEEAFKYAELKGEETDTASNN